MPESFPGYSVKRRFRGCEYDFEFLNSGRRAKGKPVEIIINDQKLFGNLLNSDSKEIGKTNKVRVYY
jgi:hypothetical protein